jgi:hypothetical protein
VALMEGTALPALEPILPSRSEPILFLDYEAARRSLREMLPVVPYLALLEQRKPPERLPKETLPNNDYDGQDS